MDRQVYSTMAQIENQHWWFQARRSIVDSIIERTVKRKVQPKILEAGCGTGGNLNMLARFGEVTAFEPDSEAREFASGKSRVKIVDGSLPGDLPFNGEKFDLIVALDVLEHVKEDEESMRQLLKLLEPGGALLITVPAFQWLWSKHDERHHHFRRYSRATLQSAISKAGGKVETVSYFNMLLFPLVAAVRLVKKGFGIDTGSEDSLPAPWLNKLLQSIFASERALMQKVSLPVGVSLMAIARPL